MTEYEILEHAIGKAQFSIEREFHLPQVMSVGDDALQITLGYDFLTQELGYFVHQGMLSSFIPYQRIIFSHQFTKSFFRESKICKDGTTYDQYLEHCAASGINEEEAKDDWEIDEECVTCAAWEYHLCKMVLHQSPIQYLERFLK